MAAEDGQNAGKLGFEKSFAKDEKPQSRLPPCHVAQFMHETRSGENTGKLGFEKSFAKEDKPQPNGWASYRAIHARDKIWHRESAVTSRPVIGSPRAGMLVLANIPKRSTMRTSLFLLATVM